MNTSPHPRAAIFGLGLLCSASLLFAGPLTPPVGPVASTNKTLQEIEPRIAINATNTPGTATCVFRISSPGSYYLPANFSVPLGKSGIEIAANNVTIDLMGHNIQAVLTAVKGITTDAARFNITIRNGTVTGFPGGGIVLTTFTGSVGVVVENIHASSNSGGGILLGENAVVRNCTANANAGDGINTRAFATVVNCVATTNSGHGIGVGSGSTVAHCVAGTNSQNGIRTSLGSIVTDCTALANLNGGIFVPAGSSVTNCSAYANTGIGISADNCSTVSNCLAYENTTSGISVSQGCTVSNCAARFNDGDGVTCSSACLILANTCSINGLNSDGAGIHAIGADNRIEGNNCSGADRGIDVDSAGNIITKNTCSGNTSNWQIAIGNAVGPIVNAGTNAVAISGNGASASSLGSTDPNANFNF